MTLGAANGRDVIIKLRPEVDESAAGVFKQFGKDVQNCQRMASEAVKEAADKTVKTWKTCRIHLPFEVYQQQLGRHMATGC